MKEYLIRKWLESGWKLIVGVALALVIAWYLHPHVALYAYKHGLVEIYDHSWTLTLLASIQVVIFLGIIGMIIQVLFGAHAIGKTKFKHK